MNKIILFHYEYFNLLPYRTYIRETPCSSKLYILFRGGPHSRAIQVYNQKYVICRVHSVNSNGRVQSWQKLRRNRILPAGLPIDHVFGQQSLHVGLFFIGVCRNSQKDIWARQREFLTDIWRTPHHVLQFQFSVTKTIRFWFPWELAFFCCRLWQQANLSFLTVMYIF